MERKTPPLLLVTYFDDACAMFGRGLISREDYFSEGYYLLKELGYEESKALQILNDRAELTSQGGIQ